VSEQRLETNHDPAPLSLRERIRTQLRARSYGALSTNAVVSELYGAARLAEAALPLRPKPHRLRSLLSASRRLRLRPLRRLLKRQLRPYVTAPGADTWRTEQIEWGRYFSSFGKITTKPLTTSLVLKAPGPNGEKGVLYSSFEYNWMRLVAHHDARRLFEEYDLVGASSWSPMDYASLANLSGLSRDPIFIGVSNLADVEAFDVMAPSIRALPLMACDWINPAYYEPKPRSEREIDILMVANWLPFKRHWLLFEALRTMGRDLRVVLIGRNAPGRTERELRREAAAFGAPQDIEMLTNVSIEEVTRHQCNARVSLLFSRREGSCVAPAESFFADTPVAMMHDAHVGSRAYINDETGILVRRRGLAHTLSRFLEEADRFAPRRWADANITCHHSSRRLNEILRQAALEAGRPWTTDIAPLCWRYVPSYVHAEDETRLAGAVDELRERHGVELVKFQYKK
jgi:glycosyltransferase involved in cell wall biosynthesis